MQRLFAIVERVRDFKMLVLEPLLVVPPLRGCTCAGLFRRNAKEEVDCGLLVRVYRRLSPLQWNSKLRLLDSPNNELA